MDRSVLEGNPHVGHRGHDDRRLRHRRARGLRLRARRVPLRRRAPARAPSSRRASAASWARTSSAPASPSTCSISEGAGAFVCGEETALIGLHRGQARHAAHAAAVPGGRGPLGQADQHQQRRDLRQRALDHRQRRRGLRGHGHRAESRGTKIFSLTGKVANGGLVEVPMGATLRARHLRRRRRHAAGPRASRPCSSAGPRAAACPPSMLDTPHRLRDADRLRRHRRLRRPGRGRRHDLHGRPGALLPAVHPGRVVRQVRALPPGHQAHARDARAHHARARAARATSSCSRSSRTTSVDGTLCALGGTAPNPVLTTLRYFRDEYEAHINEKRCPAGRCKALITYYIDAEACTGCTLCAKKCPTNVHQRREEAAARHRHRAAASSATPAARCASSAPSRSGRASERGCRAAAKEA